MFDGTLDRTPAQPAANLTSPSRRLRRKRPASTVATFMYARLHNFNAVCQSLAGEELTAFVNEVRRILSESVVKLGGEIAQRRPDSVLAIFSNAPDCAKPDHAQRGLHAAILSVSEIVHLSKRIVARFHGREVPVRARRDDGSVTEFKARVRLDTPQEVRYYRHGGILHYVLRQLASSSKAA